MSDTAIVSVELEKLRSGESTNWDRLIEVAYASLERCVRRMRAGFPGIPAETGDILHTSLIKLRKTLVQKPPESPCDFYRITSRYVRWVLIDFAEQRSSAQDLGEVDEIDTGTGPVGKAERSDLHVQLHKAVEELPASLRDVVDHLFYQELTQVEAAKELGISVPTLRVRWRDARLALMSKLGDELPLEVSEQP